MLTLMLALCFLCKACLIRVLHLGRVRKESAKATSRGSCIVSMCAHAMLFTGVLHILRDTTARRCCRPSATDGHRQCPRRPEILAACGQPAAPLDLVFGRLGFALAKLCCGSWPTSAQRCHSCAGLTRSCRILSRRSQRSIMQSTLARGSVERNATHSRFLYNRSDREDNQPLHL